jgi:hypothetical protein
MSGHIFLSAPFGQTEVCPTSDCGYYGPILWRRSLSQSAHCHKLSPYNNEACPLQTMRRPESPGLR